MSNTTAFDCLGVCVCVSVVGGGGVGGVGREKGEIGLKGSEQATAIRSRKFELFLAVVMSRMFHKHCNS